MNCASRSHVHIAARSCFFTSLFLVAASVFAADSGARTFTFRDAGIERSFELATDEVAVTKGQQIRRVIKGPRIASAGEKVDLVVYEISDGQRVGSPLIVTPEVLVEVEPGVDAAALALGAGALRVEHAVNHLYIATVTDSAAALDLATRLRTAAGVVTADPLLARKHFKRFTPNDPLFASQWHLRNTGQAGGTAGNDARVTHAWDTVRGSNIVIGIMDDGLETAHPDLAANVDTTIDWDFNQNDNDPNHDLPLAGFDEGHGTSCGGVAAAVGNNGIGISGVAPHAKLVGLRITAAAITDRGEAAAMNWSNNLIHIKNNSWGPSDDGATLAGPGALMAAAMSDACMTGRGGRGVLILWACGNGGNVGDNANYDGYANSIYSIAVGAVDPNGSRLEISEPGANVAVCAPGVGIWTTDLSGNAGAETGDYEGGFEGTSAAAPIAAGVGALMLNANSNLTWRDAKEILIRTATRNHSGDADWRTNSAGFWFNHNYGGGMVNASGAVAMAQTWINLAPMVSAVTNQSGLSVAIPDNNAAGITRTFNVTNAIRLEHVVVNVSATHTYRGNLKIELISPGNTTSVLADVHNDSGDNYSNWRFSTVRNWGESAAGTWTLRVADRTASDSGTLTEAGITLYGTPNDPPVAGTRYVSLTGSHTAPFTSWATAATNIQDAIDTADAGDTVLVSNGVYETGGRVVAGAMTNRVVIDKPIMVSSVNGSAATTIKGAWDPVTTNGDAAVRCVWMTNGATLVGFTLTNGATRTVGDSLTERSGGGVWAQSTNAVVSHCTLSGNSAVNWGGGAYRGTLNNCTLTGNSANGGGGGVFQGTLNHCTVTGNSAGKGGGAYLGTLNNCALTGNSAGQGGGALGGTLNNCTLTGNSAGISGGGGAWGGTLNNCIVYFNMAPTGSNYSSSSIINSTCTTPLPLDGTGNITNDPMFVSLATTNLQLAAGSPCINRGNNANAPGATDLAGNARIALGTVDMGALEYDGSADRDTDGFTDAEEYIADTQPTNAASFFPEVQLTNAPAGQMSLVIDPTSSDRVYGVYFNTNLLQFPQTWTLVPPEQTGTAASLTLTITNNLPAANYRTGVRLP